MGTCTADAHDHIHDLYSLRYKVEITIAHLEENEADSMRYGSRHKVRFVNAVTCMEDGS